MTRTGRYVGAIKPAFEKRTLACSASKSVRAETKLDLEGMSSKADGSQRIEDTAIRVVDFAEVRKCGAGKATRRAIEDLSRPEVVGIWVHLDADVLDDAVMPAVDHRMPGGLSWAELVTILQVAIASGRSDRPQHHHLQSKPKLPVPVKSTKKWDP